MSRPERVLTGWAGWIVLLVNVAIGIGIGVWIGLTRETNDPIPLLVLLAYLAVFGAILFGLNVRVRLF